jgi:glucan-binding YG repeat protein
MAKDKVFNLVANPGEEVGIGVGITPGGDPGVGFKAQTPSNEAMYNFADNANKVVRAILPPKVPKLNVPETKEEEEETEESEFERQRREGLEGLRAKTADAQAFGEAHGGIRHVSGKGVGWEAKTDEDGTSYIRTDDGRDLYYYNDGTTREYTLPVDSNTWQVSNEQIRDIALPAPGGPGTYAHTLQQAKESGLKYEDGIKKYYNNGYVDTDEHQMLNGLLNMRFK